MNRKEFLGKLGMGAAFALTATCLGACTKDSLSASAPVSLSLDLSDPAYADLLLVGGYIVQDKIVVARSLDGSFVAATQVCSHQALSQVIYKDDEFFCTAHSARFDLEGNGLNANGNRGLTVYQTELVGDILNVFS